VDVRKEPIVFAAAVVVLGLLAWSALEDGAPRGASGRRAEPPELAPHPAPDLALVRPAQRGEALGRRELFSPPSDTRPLPPLGLELPPLEPLPALLPPPLPGPEPRLWGRFLRGALPAIVAPGLFAAPEEPENAAADEPAQRPPRAAEDGLGIARPPSQEPGRLGPEETAARLAAWKRTYDWFRVGEYRFGQIKNPDRYRLARRTDEDLLFVEFDPERGVPRLPGQAPMRIPRRTVAEFAFADTVPNQIELRFASFGERITAADYDEALSFGIWCLRRRLEAPRALEVAAEIFRRASDMLVEDPVPRLGLAAVHESAFEFEKAFAIYRELLEGPMRNNPLVLTRLALLEARFRLFDQAEERLRLAERYGRTTWRAQEALGRLLLERGRAAEAVGHLRLANQFEPTEADYKDVRARLRAALGAALLGVGEPAEAADWFARALQADASSQEAQAGLASARLLGASPSDGAAAATAAEGRGFELLLASGLEAARAGDAASAQAARAALETAAGIDPLRASLAWRALSWLSEAAGNPEEALRFVEQALENDPTDAWALYQRARLALARDDLDGAEESLKAALERQSEFADALALLGELARRRGDLSGADRCLERALEIDPRFEAARVLRGMVLLESDRVREAEELLRGADAADPAARAGLAWCAYRAGEPTEAMTRFAELDDSRRSEPESDPWRVWARAQIARITDHLEKVVWSDHFERSSLQNGWSVQESNGPLVAIHDGLVSIAGTFRAPGRSRLWQLRSAGDFVSIEARLTVKSGTSARVGLFVARESQRGGETQVEAEATISRHPEAGRDALQVRAMQRGGEETPQRDVPGFAWPLDKPVVLRIERLGESSDARVRCSLDGIPMLDEAKLPALGRTTSELRIGAFAEGQPGRTVQLEIDDVEIVYRRKGR
jgi:tetratricopeptide (TPR) repeat protein